MSPAGRRAAGGVPAFQGTVAFPGVATLTAPDVSNPAAPVLITRSSALNIAWSGVSTGSFTAIVSQTSGSDTVLIQCRYPATDGTGTIPASALTALLPSGSGTGGGSAVFMYATENTVDVTAGEFLVHLSASGAGRVALAQVQ